MSLFGPPDVYKMKSKKDIKGLIKALGYQKDRFVQQNAASALGDLKARQAAGPLCACLNTAHMVTSAATALGEIGDPAAIPSLLPRLQGKAGFNQVRQVALALEKLGWKPDSTESKAILFAAHGQWAECATLGAPSVNPLLEALEEAIDDAAKSREKLEWEKSMESRAYQYSAVKDYHKEKEAGHQIAIHVEEARQGGISAALKSIRDPLAVEPLIAALNGSDWRIRLIAAECLSLLKEPRSLEALVKCGKNDPEPKVRTKANDGVVGFGATAVNLVIPQLKEREERKRIEAAEVLGRIGDLQAVEPLLAALQDSAESAHNAVLKALGEIGDPRAVQPLVGMLTNHPSKEAAAALSTIYRKGKLDEASRQVILTLSTSLDKSHSDYLAETTCAESHVDQGFRIPL